MLDRISDLLDEYGAALKVGLSIAVVLGFGVWWFSDRPVWVGPKAGPDSRVLILLHGHGASKDDLKPLAMELSQVADVSFIIPSAPHRSGAGRTWYPSFTVDSQDAAEERIVEQRAAARAIVLAIVKDLRAQQVPAEEIYVGGFSQGATVALDVVLSEEGAELGGLVSLSGGALKLDLKPLAERDTLRAFVSHGKSDQVLRGDLSKVLVEALRQGGHQVKFVEFDGGHAIPSTVVRALGQFLQAQ